MTETIDSFKGKYDFLSNFYLNPLEISFKALPNVTFTYPSAENAFQVGKLFCTNLSGSELLCGAYSFTAMTPREARTAGKTKIDLTPEQLAEWENRSVAWMMEILRIKFTNSHLYYKLLETGTATLIEENTWGDRKWGMVDGVGQNLLGRCLMNVRDYLEAGTHK